MPKLGTFKDQPLHEGVVEFLEQMFNNPGTGQNRSIIQDIIDLSQHPKLPMTYRLACFITFDLGLIRGMHENMLLNATDEKENKVPCEAINNGGKTKVIQLIQEMNEWVLRHVYAAGLQKLIDNRSAK